jgi:hypothetical protein
LTALWLSVTASVELLNGATLADAINRAADSCAGTGAVQVER